MLAADPLALAALRDALGPRGWTEDADRIAPRLLDWRGRRGGPAAFLALPAGVEEVQAVVRIAARHRVGLVPQGGRTGLVGGALPAPEGGAILLGLERMARIRSVDPAGLALVAEAGVTLDAVRAAAAQAGCTFPLSLAARGSAQLGGLVSTNAGGVQVLRWGPMRALVLGLEAVLASGDRLDGLGPLRKDNTGYDIKQLLIGAEGTLGIVTAAALALKPAPAERAVAWAGLATPAAALALLARLRTALGEAVESFELVPAASLELVLAHLPGYRAPLAAPTPWHALIEVADARADTGLRASLERALAAALEAGELADVALAESEAQAAALWALREGIPEAERRDGHAVKHDIAVPVASVPRFLAEATPAVEAAWPGARVVAFGHLGDGNLHYNVRAPAGPDSRAWVEAHGPAITRAVHDRVRGLGGSISAEHGIGSVKRDELLRLGDPAKLAAMRAVKAALDPLGIMNPGKLL